MGFKSSRMMSSTLRAVGDAVGTAWVGATTAARRASARRRIASRLWWARIDRLLRRRDKQRVTETMSFPVEGLGLLWKVSHSIGSKPSTRAWQDDDVRFLFRFDRCNRGFQSHMSPDVTTRTRARTVPTRATHCPNDLVFWYRTNPATTRSPMMSANSTPMYRPRWSA